jgi:site-specific DNA recombinase
VKTLENTGKGEKSMVKKVTVIKAAKAQKHTQEERRLKVCGYARVSSVSPFNSGSNIVP